MKQEFVHLLTIMSTVDNRITCLFSETPLITGVRYQKQSWEHKATETAMFAIGKQKRQGEKEREMFLLKKGYYD